MGKFEISSIPNEVTDIKQEIQIDCNFLNVEFENELSVDSVKVEVVENEVKPEIIKLEINDSLELETTNRSYENTKNYIFKCKYCSFEASNLQFHFMNEHRHEKLIYICKYCDFHTKYPQNLKQHENEKHIYNSFLLCHICGHSSRNPSNFKRHIRSVHSKSIKCEENIPRYDCLYCGYFTTRFTGHSEEAQKFYKDAGTLAEGVVNIYLPSLIKAKAHMQELEEKQKVLTDHMHEQNLKISRVHDLHLKMEMFDRIKIYEKKLSGLKKDMRQLHEWSTKLKIRAEKIEEASRRNIQL